MKSFETFALYVLQGLHSPIVVVNDRTEVITANEAGWELLGGNGKVSRGRTLDAVLRPSAMRVRTPVTALQGHDPLAGWSSILGTGARRFPRVALRSASDEEGQRVLSLEISPVEGSELLALATTIKETHPEWLDDESALARIQSLISPTNSILLFQDVTDIALCEVKRQECMRNTLDVVVRTLDHYIRNALTPILGYSDLIRRKGETLSPRELGRITDKMSRHVYLITAILDALRTVRDIHIEEPLGADATLIGIEKDLKARMEELNEVRTE